MGTGSAPARRIDAERGSHKMRVPALLKATSLFLPAALLVLPSCVPSRVGGDRAPDQVIHELRREKVELARAVDDLEKQIESRLAQIGELEGLLAEGKVSVAGVAPGDLPRVVHMRFGRYSAAVDSDDDGQDDLIRLFVRTLDQKGRFLPVAGRADIQAVQILPGAVPVLVAGRTLAPPELDQAYRSSFMGTHYRLDLPLPADAARTRRQVTVKVSITDAASGATISQERPMVINGAN